MMFGATPSAMTPPFQMFGVDPAGGLAPIALSPTTPLDRDLYPVLSPDGRWLASRARGGRAASDLYLADLDASPPIAARVVSTDLTGTETAIPGYVFSPDSSWIAYVVDDGTNRILDLAATGGGAPIAVVPSTPAGIDAMLPSFSEDGRWLLYISDHASRGRHNLYAAAIDASGPGASTSLRPASVPSFARAEHVRPAVNSHAVAFVYELGGLDDGLFVAELSGAVPSAPKTLRFDAPDVHRIRVRRACDHRSVRTDLERLDRAAKQTEPPLP